MSMTIGELLDILAPLNPYKEVIFDFGYLAPTVVNSWRGSYNEPALGYGVYGYSSSPTGFRPPTVGVLVEELKGAISVSATRAGREVNTSTTGPAHCISTTPVTTPARNLSVWMSRTARSRC